jgi:hypothetical protein
MRTTKPFFTPPEARLNRGMVPLETSVQAGFRNGKKKASDGLMAGAEYDGETIFEYFWVTDHEL